MPRSRSRARPLSWPRLLLIVLFLVFFVVAPSLVGVLGNGGSSGLTATPTAVPLGR